MTVKFATSTPYVVCIGDLADPGRHMVEIVDVEAGTNIDNVLIREVRAVLDDYCETTIDRAYLDPNNGTLDVATLTITYDEKGNRGPFGGPWFVAKIAPAVRAVAEDKQLSLPLQLAS